MSDNVENRLRALEQPGNLALPLEKRDFWLMAGVALFFPIALLAIAWGW